MANMTSDQPWRKNQEKHPLYDPLTGLGNRTLCDQEMERMERSAIRPACVIYVEVIGLKMFNAALGQEAADSVFRNAASLLKNCVRHPSGIYRIESDEFLVLQRCCNEENCADLRERIRASFAFWNSSDDAIPLYAACGCAAVDSTLATDYELEDFAFISACKAKKREMAKAYAAIAQWIKKVMADRLTVTKS